MIKEKAFLLADKLEGRGYRQTTGWLRTGPREFCCLGVACQIAKINSIKTDKKSEKGLPIYEYDRSSDFLPKKAMDFFGFFNSRGKRRDQKLIIIDNQECYGTLSEANDHNVSFKKIAKYIRENYEAL